MATLEQIGEALRRADAAGNAEDASILARAYADMKSSAKAQPEQQAQQLEDPSFMVGVGKGMADTVRGVTDLVGASDQFGDTQKADAVINEKAPAGRFVGNVVSTLPAMFIPGANTIAGGAAIGAGSGLLFNQGNAQERLQNAGVGALGGAGGAVLGKAVPYAAKVAETMTAPFRSEASKNQILARMLQRVVGDNAVDVAARLENPQILVKGTQPTAAEIGQSGGLSALQRYAEQAAPENYQFRRTQNADARSAVLRGLAKDETNRAGWESFRESATSPLYQQAKGQTLPVDDTLLGLLQRPSMSTALGHAEQIAAEQGMPIDPVMRDMILNGQANGFINGDALHHLKIGLDAAMKDPKNPLTGAQQRALRGTIGEFEQWREANMPDYAKAQKLYRKLSRPINQIDVGQALYDKAKPALTDYGNTTRETAQTFARALRDGDATAKKATGFNNATLANVLTKRQLNEVNNVAKDMARKANADELGRGIGSNTFQNFAMKDLGEAAGMPGGLLARGLGLIPVVGGMANAGVHAATANAEREMQAMLADALLDPKRAAELLKLAEDRGALSRFFANKQYGAIPGIMGAQTANTMRQE
jgi:hypothetical protein